MAKAMRNATLPFAFVAPALVFLAAVLGWPLGSTAPRSPAAMVNCIGALPERAAVLAVPGAHLYDYGKDARPGRKVGHVTIVASDAATLEERLARVASLVDA